MQRNRTGIEGYTSYMYNNDDGAHYESLVRADFDRDMRDGHEERCALQQVCLFCASRTEAQRVTIPFSRAPHVSLIWSGACIGSEDVGCLRSTWCETVTCLSPSDFAKRTA